MTVGIGTPKISRCPRSGRRRQIRSHHSQRGLARHRWCSDQIQHWAVLAGPPRRRCQNHPSGLYSRAFGRSGTCPRTVPRRRRLYSRGGSASCRLQYLPAGNEKPDFQTVYFSGLDEIQHEYGPHTPETFQTLEKLDVLVGQVRTAAERIEGGKSILCVVSDHGHIRVDKVLNLNAALYKEGLIELNDQRKLKSWRAYAWVSGASCCNSLKRTRRTKMPGREWMPS